MKSRIFIIGILLTLVLVSSVHAKTDITGDAYGESVTTMDMQDVGVLFGVTIEDLNVVGENCDNTAQTCLLEGFSWADSVGWTYWDGLALQSELGAAFPNEYIAKATYNGNLGGFIWGEKYGWIALSSCNTIDVEATCSGKSYCTWSAGKCDVDKTGNPPIDSAQTSTDYGVYIDFCPLKPGKLSCENAIDDSDKYCNWDTDDAVCVFDKNNNPNGQPFKGYAWSEYLGWIKFGPEAGETEFTGAFTNWFPDLTPPVFKGIEDAWIPNEHTLGTISWPEFADENESFVNLVPGPHQSKISINSIDPLPCTSATTLVISQGDTGEANLTIPLIGKIGAPPNGFCRHTLGGVLYNSSGFGYYFGPEGKAAAEAKLLDVNDMAPNVYDPDPVNLYIRAGGYNDYNSKFNDQTPANAVADGNTTSLTELRLVDRGGNPIMPVKSGLVPVFNPGFDPEDDPDDWIRDVKLLYDFSTSDYHFDSIDWIRDEADLANPIPVRIESFPYLSQETLQFPTTGPTRPILLGSYYPLDVTAYAPTTTVGNSLILNNIELTPIDLELPAISPSQPALPATSTPIIPGVTPGYDPMAGLPNLNAFQYEPMLEVIEGSLNTDFIVISTPVEATYKLRNNSNINLTEYSLDHILSLKDASAGLGEELLEVNNINLTLPATLPPSDAPGQTDPDSGETRYLLIQGGSATPNSNQFHNADQNYHVPNYGFGSDPLDADGVYKIGGALYVAPGDECLDDPPTCPKVNLDRTDPFSIDVFAPLETDIFKFAFTPSQFIGETVNAQINFGITQYIAHPAPDPMLYPGIYALYPAIPFIDGIEVKSVGLSTSGTVSGTQIFETGRDLETITTTSSADLRREIRKNVAVLTRNLTPCATPPTLDSLPTSGDCVIVDDTNKTALAFYRTDSLAGTDTMSLENPTGPIVVPADYKYTIILDGANLNLGANITYGSGTDNSLGIIVMKNSDEEGGEVFIDPSITNVVGLLYAEGSLRSRDSTGQFYYGGGGASIDLRHQLYWQGSIASKNTIGGAPKKVKPVGVDCEPWGDNIVGCAQAYDLDFIRRFATVHLDPEDIDFSSIGSLFSGGGNCPGASPNPACVLGGSLPTTVTLIVSGINTSIDVDNSKSLDTFFIERDNRPVPPGFSSGGGLSSSQEIR